MQLQKTEENKLFTIFNFFYFKCTIDLIDNIKITCRKSKMCLLNITFLHKLFYRITTRITKSLFLHKTLARKKSKYFFFSDLRRIQEKMVTLTKKNTLPFKIRKDNFSSENPIFKKVYLLKYVCCRTNHGLFFHKNSFKLI